MRRATKVLIFGAASLVLAMPGAAAETMQLTVGGQARTFLLERPPTQEPRPTIIMLHGAGGSATQVAQSTGLGQQAPRHGFVAVFPQGRGGRWNHLPPGKEAIEFVRVFEQYGGAPDDVAFLKALVAELVRRGISEPARIFLAGESAGGIMTLRMACADAELFAGIGLLIAAMPAPTGADCRPAKSFPVLMINGTADEVLPYGGGPSAPPDRAFGRGTFKVWPTEGLVAFFRGLNGCVGLAEESVVPGNHTHTIEIEQWRRCAGGPVTSYRIVAGGHAIPAGLNVGELLLSFFR